MKYHHSSLIYFITQGHIIYVVYFFYQEVININVLIIDSGVNIPTTESINCVPYEDSTDYLNHGTVIAKIITTINPQANIYSAKITDRGGSTLNDKLAQALLYALTHNIDIINISLGLPHYSDTVQDIINRLHKQNTIIIAAAGNNTSVYPALYNNVISVGATDDKGNIEPYSASADVYTYGTVTINNINYTGTSYSTAIITGILSRGGYKE